MFGLPIIWSVLSGPFKVVGSLITGLIDLCLKYPRETIIALLALFSWWALHEKAKAERHVAHLIIARNTDAAIWQGIERINHASIDKLIAAITSQSDAVDGWAKVARAHQAAAQIALKDAQAHGRALDTARAAISAERASGCKTGAAVMAAKGEL